MHEISFQGEHKNGETPFHCIQVSGASYLGLMSIISVLMVPYQDVLVVGSLLFQRAHMAQ